MTKELLQQALNALEKCLYPQHWQIDAMKAIRAHLAQPAPAAVPVAWMLDTTDGKLFRATDSKHNDDWLPLYTAPPAPVPEEFDMADDGGCPVCGEDGGTSCGMPNCGLLSAPPVPQAEPVAWLKTMYSGTRPMLEVDHLRKDTSIPVYTHPAAPVPVPLTDEQDRALCEAHCNDATDEYFNARPQLDSAANRRIFYAGHRKGWIAHAIAASPEVPK